MRTATRNIVPLVVAFMLSSLSLTPVQAQYEELVTRAKPSVVLIAIETSRGIATGSGFFVDQSGYVVTARHVIEDASKVVVLTADGRQLPAIVVRYSSLFDAAVLKVEGSGFPTLSWGDADAVRIGQEILVLGYPFATILGMESITATRGIVSALRPSQGLLQIDAALNPGNSGGPVLNLRGEVVGVAIAGVRGGLLLNLAVSSSLLRTITSNLTPIAIPAPNRVAPSGPVQPSPPSQPTPAPVTSAPQNLIRPGEGIGLLRLGMTIRQATQALGPYLSTGSTYGWDSRDRPVSGWVMWIWNAPGPEYILLPRFFASAQSANGMITDIQTSSAAFITPGGNRVGGRFEDFVTEFGQNNRDARAPGIDYFVVAWPSIYVSLGIGMSDQRVRLIGVRR